MTVHVIKRTLAEISRRPGSFIRILLFGAVFTAVVGAMLFIPLVGVAFSVVAAVALLIGCHRIIQGENVTIESLFTGVFTDWKQVLHVVLGKLWTGFWMLLWALVPVVGIIRMLEYSMVPFILYYRPEVSIFQVREESRRMVYGHKAQMFFSALLTGLFFSVLFLFWGLISSLLVRARVLFFLMLLPMLALLFALILFYALTVELLGVVWYEELIHPTMPAFTAPVSGAAPQNGAAAQPEGSEVRYCPECGTKIVGAAAFCHNCGHKMS